MAPDLLLIVGKGRSGSTIVGDILGSIDDVFHAGELWRLWRSGLTGEHRCSCGSTTSECPVWGPVESLMRSGTETRWSIEQPSEFLALQQRLFSFQGVLSSLPHRGRRRFDKERYRLVLNEVCDAIREVTASHMVVDSSKWPADPASEQTGTRVIHLVKDPCAVARSWSSHKVFPDTGEPMPTFSSAHTAVSWTARNLLAEFNGRAVGPRQRRIRYEDFVARPKPTTEDLTRWLEVDASTSNLFVNDRTVNLRPGHTIMGNPSRFAAGPTTIHPASSVACTGRFLRLATLPLRMRYGY